MNTIDWIKQHKVIAIVRGVQPENILQTAQALYAGGIRLLEVTFNQSSQTGEQDTLKSIQIVSEAFKDRLCVGAGTVMTPAQVTSAVEAGAKYIISPNTDAAVIHRTKELEAVSLPGAMTPSEIVSAYQYGADFVKIFPAGILGLPYIQAIRSPISHIPMLAVGGIDENNMKAYLAAGLCGVGIGSNLVNLKLIASGQYEELTKLALKYTIEE